MNNYTQGYEDGLRAGSLWDGVLRFFAGIIIILLFARLVAHYGVSVERERWETKYGVKYETVFSAEIASGKAPK